MIDQSTGLGSVVIGVIVPCYGLAGGGAFRPRERQARGEVEEAKYGERTET
ncbi:hypothetical protein [Natrinema salaciae]|uniref:Uncharacterized protein n=1 Tax=Natrinema salaciae TaxID=1186196 RepID=A0A1H9IR67_9EURY|nr:hypothetical protein [Natrinema salaciae]SEQ76992.1 hypothetical protein SAMN04489841_2307 [Natrinema salaciae]